MWVESKEFKSYKPKLIRHNPYPSNQSTGVEDPIVSQMRVLAEPVPRAVYDEAVARKLAGKPLPDDEVILSHAVSRGVAPGTESKAKEGPYRRYKPDGVSFADAVAGKATAMWAFGQECACVDCDSACAPCDAEPAMPAQNEAIFAMNTGMLMMLPATNLQDWSPVEGPVGEEVPLDEWGTVGRAQLVVNDRLVYADTLPVGIRIIGEMAYYNTAATYEGESASLPVPGSSSGHAVGDAGPSGQDNTGEQFVDTTSPEFWAAIESGENPHPHSYTTKRRKKSRTIEPSAPPEEDRRECKRKATSTEDPLTCELQFEDSRGHP